MSAFAQTSIGDLDISKGNLVVRSDTAQVTAWKLSNILSLVKGEWFLDQRIGMPYLQYVFVNNPSQTLIQSLFQKALLLPPGVLNILSLAVNINKSKRTLAVPFTVETVDGATISGGLGQPLIVDVRAE